LIDEALAGFSKGLEKYIYFIDCSVAVIYKNDKPLANDRDGK